MGFLKHQSTTKYTATANTPCVRNATEQVQRVTMAGWCSVIKLLFTAFLPELVDA